MHTQLHLHIQRIAVLEKQKLKIFAQQLLEFIEYLEGYAPGIIGKILFSNPLARMLWPPEQGWPVTLVQSQTEMDLCAELSMQLRQFIASIDDNNTGGSKKEEISSIELILAMNKFIDELPANSLFLQAPGVKEPFGGVEDLVNTAKEVLNTKMPEQMTTALIARELELSLLSIDMHQKLIDESMTNHRQGNSHTQDGTAAQHASSVQAIAELLLLLANVEKYMCKAYLVDDLLQCLPLDSATVKEVVGALERAQYQAVKHRLSYIRREGLTDKGSLVVVSVDEALGGNATDIHAAQSQNFTSDIISNSELSNSQLASMLAPNMVTWLIHTVNNNSNSGSSDSDSNNSLVNVEDDAAKTSKLNIANLDKLSSTKKPDCR